MKINTKLGTKYIEVVINPLLPNALWDSYVGSEFNLFGINQLSGSKYDREFIDDSYFLHFTNIDSLLEIIRSKKIRLSDFNSFDDPFELTLANKNLVDDFSVFDGLKSCLFAFSMCEDSDDNLQNDYMWNNYGKEHKGVCIKLKLDKVKSRFLDFHLGKIIYSDSDEIEELTELKNRHLNFENSHKWSISNLDNILLSVCSMYKKTTPYSEENEIRLLANIKKSNNGIHTNGTYPIRHKFDEGKNMIQYFFELELEYENKNGKCQLPHLSIDSIYLGKKLYGNTIGQLLPVIKYEFNDSFNRKLDINPLFYQ